MASGLLVVACRSESPSTPKVAGDSTADVPLAVRNDDHVFAGGKAPPGAGEKNPYEGDAKSVTEGAQLFLSMHCNECHGAEGSGNWAPNLSDNRWRYGGSDAALFESIFYGRPNGMPAFGGLLQPPIVWKLVSYLRSLKPPAAVPTQSW